MAGAMALVKAEKNILMESFLDMGKAALWEALRNGLRVSEGWVLSSG